MKLLFHVDARRMTSREIDVVIARFAELATPELVFPATLLFHVEVTNMHHGEIFSLMEAVLPHGGAAVVVT